MFFVRPTCLYCTTDSPSQAFFFVSFFFERSEGVRKANATCRSSIGRITCHEKGHGRILFKSVLSGGDHPTGVP